METHTWSQTQTQRLKELGADESALSQPYATAADRNLAFQKLEKQLVKSARSDLARFLTREGKPRFEQLRTALCDMLIAEGFAQVTTPTIINRAALAKMTITPDHPLSKQVFWLNDKQCLRPMLATNLYSLMVDFGRQKHRPIRFFEIGSCFRKETDGARHNNEFTMLNLVEMGSTDPDPSPADLLDRLKDLAHKMANAAGITEYEFETEESDVYGSTLDLVCSRTGTELASGATGPHPLDAAWGVTDPWVGMGFGVERLLMSARGDTTIGKWARSLAYQDGIRLNI